MKSTLSRRQVQVPLSNGEPSETITGEQRPDYVAVFSARPSSGEPGRVVALRHGFTYLPDLTPREALRIALAIFLAALTPAGGLS